MQAFHAFIINNEGIQVRLPFRPYQVVDMYVLQAVLARSREGSSRPVTIGLIVVAHEVTGPPLKLSLTDVVLVLEGGAAETGIKVADTNTQLAGVTTVEFHHIRKQRRVWIVEPIPGCAIAYESRSPVWDHRLVRTRAWMTVRVSEEIYQPVSFCTGVAPSPRERRVLNTDRGIVLLTREGCTVFSMARRQMTIPFYARLHARLLTTYVLAVLVVLLAILVVRCPTTPSAPHAFDPLTIISTCFSRWSYWFRNGEVVFTFLLLRTDKAEEAMNEFLPIPNTEVWRKWRAIALDSINHGRDLNYSQ